jgi:hypothetical protein
MGTSLRNNCPSNFEQRLEGMFCLHARPLTQAEAQSTLIERGTFLEFSTSSAMTRKASAYAFLLASSSVLPYTITPGTAAISAIQRPSSSRSVSIFQFTSSLLTLAGGFLRGGILIRCWIPRTVTHYAGNALRTYNNTPFSYRNPQVHVLRLGGDKVVRQVSQQLLDILFYGAHRDI